MKIERFEETPITTGYFDDRWYTKPATLFLPKGHYCLLAIPFWCFTIESCPFVEYLPIIGKLLFTY